MVSNIANHRASGAGAGGRKMRKGNLSRDQVIELVGLDAVESVENENCDYTNRVQTDGDDSVEFSAIINCVDSDGTSCKLIAYYYQDQNDIDNTDDLSSLNWEINGYEIV